MAGSYLIIYAINKFTHECKYTQKYKEWSETNVQRQHQLPWQWKHTCGNWNHFFVWSSWIFIADSTLSGNGELHNTCKTKQIPLSDLIF